MAKDAYYFPHDSNAKDDPKCVLMIEQLGLESYGAYWVLVETLRDQPGYRYPLALIPALARRYNTTAQKLEAVVKSYGLFQTDGEDFFFSDSLNRRMEIYEEKRDKYRLSGKVGAEKRWQRHSDAIATLKQRHSDAIASKVNESKVNKTKEKEIKDIGASRFAPPTVEEVRAYCIERNNAVNPDRFHDFYECKGWMVGKNKMKDWRAAVRQWEQRDNEKQKPNSKFAQSIGTMAEWLTEREDK